MKNKLNSFCDLSIHPGLILAAVLLAAFVLCSCSPAAGSDTTGEGAAALKNPSQGLETLQAYQAAYRIGFEGQQAGAEISWEESYTQSVLRDPPAHAMTMTSTGENLVPGTVPVFFAELGNIIYWRDLPSDSCFSAFKSTLPEVAGSTGSSLEELAYRLPPISALEADGDLEMILGQEAFPYTFDESALTIPGKRVTQGRVWLAAEGGHVVQFQLEFTVRPEDSGTDLTGTYTINYALEPIEATIDAVLPLDCRLPLPEIAMIPDASGVINLPGYLEYSTGSSVEDSAAFYQGAIERAGYQVEQPPAIEETYALLEAAAPGQTLVIRIRGGEATTVRIIGHRAASAITAGPESQSGETPAAEEPGAAPTADEPAVRVMEALNLLIPTDEGPGALPSYHLEVHHTIPAWDPGTGSVRLLDNQLLADIEGANVHFTDRTYSADGSLTVTEAYVIEGQEYVVNNGVPTPGYGMAALTWTFWPLDPSSIISAGVSGAAFTGIELVADRPAEVYTIQGTGLPGDFAAGLEGFVLPVTSAAGTVWVDQDSGALVKAVLDYTADLKDANGAVQGQGSGHMEITVTKIGMVSVVLPNQ